MCAHEHQLKIDGLIIELMLRLIEMDEFVAFLKTAENRVTSYMDGSLIVTKPQTHFVVF